MYSSHPSSSGHDHQVIVRSTTDHAQQWMWMKRHRSSSSSHLFPNSSSAAATWEEGAFAEDASGVLGGCIWPPRSYSCSFCGREFRSAQALGGHMNVHRRDRARLKQQQSHQEEEEDQDNNEEHHPTTTTATNSSPRVSSSSTTTTEHSSPAANRNNAAYCWLDLGLMVNIVESSRDDELSGHYYYNDVEAIFAGGKRRKTVTTATSHDSPAASSEGMGICRDLDLELRL